MDAIYGLWILAALLGLYFLPTLLAFNRKAPNPWSIAVINGLLGWTLIGWAVALAMAVRDKPRLAANQDGTVGQRVDVERRAVSGDGL